MNKEFGFVCFYIVGDLQLKWPIFCVKVLAMGNNANGNGAAAKQLSIWQRLLYFYKYLAQQSDAMHPVSDQDSASGL